MAKKVHVVLETMKCGTRIMGQGNDLTSAYQDLDSNVAEHEATCKKCREYYNRGMAGLKKE